MIRKLQLWALALVGVAGLLVPQAAGAQVSRVIEFYNACTSPIEFIINHSNERANWHPHGWYKLRPYQSSTFTESAGGALLKQMDGYSLYFYARATDGTGRTWSGTNNQYFQGTSYPFAKMNTTIASNGSIKASITCDDPPPSGDNRPGGYSSSSTPSRIIQFYSSCSSPIEFIINNSPGAGNWATHGWYKLQPYTSSTFEANGITLRQMDGYSLYFYARSTDGTNRTWTGTNRQMFQSAEYPFMKMTTSVLSNGYLRGTITC